MGEHGGDHADAAIWAFRAFVGRDRIRLVLVVTNVIRAGDEAGACRRVEQRTERPDPVSADVGVHRRADAQHASVATHRGAEPDALVASVAGRLEVLGPGLGPFDRLVHPPGDPGQQDLLRVDLGLDTEASAHVGCHDADPPRIQREGLGDRNGDKMRDLGRAPDGDAAGTFRSSTQVPHLVAVAIAETLALDPGRVRVVAADVGGGFGIKAQVYPEEILLAWIARRMNKAVKWTETRFEHFQSASHARDQRIRFSAAVRSDGRVLGIRATVHANIGAYGIRPFGPLLDPITCVGLIPGPYDIRDYEYESYAVATNKCPEGPYRGVGMVTAVLAHERLMDLIAARLALDPAEVRRVNFVTQAQMPYVAATGHPYESGDYGAALDAALAAFGYAGAREEQVRARAEGRRLGIGIGSYVEFTGAGSSTFEGRGMADIPGTDTARLWLGEDGRVHLQTTCPAIGQGVHTTFAQVAAASLGVEPENIVVEQTDTSRVGPGTGAFMSRGSVTAATSAYRAGRLLREAILSAASWRLDQPVERLSIGASVILIDGQRSSITLAQLAAGDLAGNGGHALDASVTYDAVQASHPCATHVCLVEVDAETGAVQILGYVVAEDCGVLINPMIVEGQVVGGIAQGIGAV